MVKRNKKGQFISYPENNLKCKYCTQYFTVKKNSKRKFCTVFCYTKSQIGAKRPDFIGKLISKAKKGKVIISEKQKRQIRKKLKGRKLSEETCKKMSESRKGLFFPGKFPTPKQRRSIKWRRKISKSNTGKKQSLEIRTKKMGKNAYNWKGCIDSPNKKARQSYEYKEWRKSVFKRDNWICQKCKIKGGILHAHHIKPFSQYPEFRYIMSNGKTLCKVCHKKTRTWGGKNNR